MVAVSLFLSANLLVPFIIYEGCFYTYIATQILGEPELVQHSQNVHSRLVRTYSLTNNESTGIATHRWRIRTLPQMWGKRQIDQILTDSWTQFSAPAPSAGLSWSTNFQPAPSTFTDWLHFFPCATVDLQLGFCTRFLAFFSSTSGNLKARKSAQCWCINWQRTKLRTPCHSQKHCIKPCCLNQTAVIDSNKT